MADRILDLDSLGMLPDEAAAQEGIKLPSVAPKPDPWAWLDEKTAEPPKYDAVTQKHLDEHDTLWDHTKHFLGEAASELALGLPKKLYRDSLSAQDRKNLDAWDAEHTTDDVGKVAGFVGGALATGGVLGGAGRAARGIAGLAEETVAQGLGKRLAGEAVEQAAVAAPRALADAFTQDPKTAAENFGLAVITGGVLGTAAKAATKAVLPTVEKMSQRGAQVVRDYSQEQNAVVKQFGKSKIVTDKAREIAKNTPGGVDGINSFIAQHPELAQAQTVEEQLAKSHDLMTDYNTQFGKLNSTPGVAPEELLRAKNLADTSAGVKLAIEHAATTNKSAGLFDTITDPSSKMGVQALMLNAVYHVPVVGPLVASAAGAAKIGKSALDAAARTEFGRRLANGTATFLQDDATALFNRSVSQLTSATKYVVPAAMSHFNRDTTLRDGPDLELARRAALDPETNPVVAALKDSDALTPAAKSALSQHVRTMNTYVSDSFPKRSTPPDPLDPDRPWRPSRTDLQAFGDKLEVTNNPLVVVQRLRDGTLSKNHIEALDKVWPSTRAQLQDALMDQVADPKNTELRSFLKKRRRQFDMLMGTLPQFASEAPNSAQPTLPSSTAPASTSKQLSQSGLEAAEPQTDLAALQG